MGASQSWIEEDQPGLFKGQGHPGETQYSHPSLENIHLTNAQDIKLRYYDLMVQLALQDDEYLEACQAYQEVWDTEEVKNDSAKELSVSL